MIFLEHGIVILQDKFWGGYKDDFIFIPVDQVSELEIGSDTHTEYAGMTSKTTHFWILKVNNVNMQSYSRWLKLGTTEAEINSQMPRLGAAVKCINLYYDVTQGDSWQTSGGYTTSYGFIW